MTFAALPLFVVLGGMALAALLVVGVYLLRRTPRALVVSNVDFWLRAAQKAKPRLLASFRIPLLALLLSLLVALAMVALIGDPRFGAGVRGTTVVVLDLGRTMSARGPDGARRIDRAVAEVRRWVERSTIAGEVVVVGAGMRPRVLVPATEHTIDLERALVDLAPDDGPSDLAAGVALAEAIVVERSRPPAGSAASRSNGAPILGQILVVTDQAAEASALRARAPLVTLPVGTEVDTVAITAFAARRVPEAVGEYTAYLAIRNLSAHPARLRVRVVDGEVALVDQRLSLAPHGEEVIRAEGFSSHRAELHASLEAIALDGSEDGFAGDDRASAVVEALDATRVLLVSEGDRFLEAALAAHPGLDVEVVPPASLAHATTDALARYHVVVLDHASLPAGVSHRALVAFAPVDGAAVGVGRRLSAPPITGTLASHPVLEGLVFDDVHLTHASALVERPGDQVLLRSRESVVALAREGRAARLVAFGFGTGDTDLVRRETFPLLVHDALRWAADRGEASPLPRPLGAALVVEAGEDVTGPIDAAGSGGAVALVRDAAGVGEVPLVTRAGLYHVGDRTLAFGAVRHAGPLTSGATGGRFLSPSALPPLAVLVAAALLLVMLVEWTLLHRGRLE